MEETNGDNGGVDLVPEVPVTPSITPTVESSIPAVVLQPPTDNLEFFVRPMDGEWAMGEDWPLSVHKDFTIVDLKNHIEEVWGISPFRLQFRLKNGKLIPGSKHHWSLRRHGLSSGYVLKVEPTLSNSKSLENQRI